MITGESLMVLKNSCTFAGSVNREYSDQFAKTGAKIGNTVNVRKPVRYLGRTGEALSVESTTETSVPIVINTVYGVDLSFSDFDLTLSIDRFSERYIKPAIANIASKIDGDGLALYKDVYNTVGTPGTNPSAFTTYLDAGVKLDNEAAPQDEQRYVVLNPQGRASFVGANTLSVFNPNSDISKQYRKGTIGETAGFTFKMDQNVQTHTVGALGGTPLVNGASQSGSSLVTDGWTAAAATRLKKGDVFTIAGVFAVNPQTRVTTGQLRQFVVTADAASDASGNMTISISPSITASGQYQTVTAAPADNAAITVLGAANTQTAQNLAFHRDAFTLAMVDLEMPSGVDMASRMSDGDYGMSIRMVRAYDINTNRRPCRLDVAYGWATLRPELACRIAG